MPADGLTWSPTRANGQPAFGVYLRSDHGISHGVGLYVLSLAGDQICAMVRFENTVLPCVRAAAVDPQADEFVRLIESNLA